MSKIALWASPHKITEEQKNSLEGLGYTVETMNDSIMKELSNMSLETDRASLARQLNDMMVAAIVQPGGDPAFQFQLGKDAEEARTNGTRTPQIMYAFSKRVIQDIQNADGTITKKSIFKFEGWL